MTLFRARKSFFLDTRSGDSVWNDRTKQQQKGWRKRKQIVKFNVKEMEVEGDR